MAGNKTLNARLSLKCDTYANWTSNNPVLLAGEAAVTVVPGETGAVQREPAVLVKFGDGTSHYNDLQFMSAKSADVYDWAMQAQKPTYQASEIQGLDDYISGQIKDTDTQYQLVRVSDTSFKLQSKEKNGDEWADVTTIEITYNLTEGETNGTVKFNGVDVAVHGLKSAAYQDTTAFDAAGSADAVQGNLDTHIQNKQNPHSVAADQIGAAKPGYVFYITLLASNWVDNSQTVSDIGFVTSGYAYLINPSDENFISWNDCIVRGKDVEQAGKMNFICEEQPSSDIVVKIVRMEVSA
ncbi:hypothetical protein B5G34_00805 [Flavonifractor sp. An82]|uniref:hypothetical protein n=1 Tax=Flavonifractor sp. An82 TaxID=1965660 RepID=UPI000B373F70|nr:hypothetical protein [Flavonifractor sp. An82]OUN23668.1 hypothetical protein B5G34_00805 [Flavonifractor sp. An82]